MEPWLREIVRCPVCRAELRDVTAPDATPALQCGGSCRGEAGVFAVRDGIPVLLPPSAFAEPSDAG